MLGVQWLEKLGTVSCNWKQMTMEFQWDNQTQKLQGTDGQLIQSASMKVVSKELRQGNSMFAICVQTEAELPLNRVGFAMQELLQAFEDIFQEPKQLPPAGKLITTSL